jgi:hypothetical protein
MSMHQIRKAGYQKEVGNAASSISAHYRISGCVYVYTYIPRSTKSWVL